MLSRVIWRSGVDSLDLELLRVRSTSHRHLVLPSNRKIVTH